MINKRLFLIGFAWALVLCIVFVAGIATWRYINSFQEVTFNFDDSDGYIQIVGEDKQKLYPVDGQPAKLKKGDYTLKNQGNRVAEDTQFITIDGETDSIDIDFAYTESYLGRLYAEQKSDIESALYAQLPKLREQYTVSNGALYSKGEVYGATLTARNSSENSDLLHVLLLKKDDKWELLHTPQPILTVAEYPNIPRAALSAINRGK